MDAFDRFWQWADKPPESLLTIPAELRRAVMELAPEDRRREPGRSTRTRSRMMNAWREPLAFTHWCRHRN
jgi:hypothetical protein